MRKIEWVHINAVVVPLCTFLLWMNPKLGLYVFIGICIWVAIGFWWVRAGMKDIELPDEDDI